jgi:hypothetical protein
MTVQDNGAKGSGGDSFRFPPVVTGPMTDGLKRVSSCPQVAVYPEVRAHTPRHFGFNLEVQMYAERTNLWDWVADSGASAVREFHPEINLRRKPVREGAWGRIAGRADFEAIRAKFRADPSSVVDWANYRFEEEIPWMGVPDRILEQITRLGAMAMVPMGYVPRMFPRPLVTDPDLRGTVPDSAIDWEAATSAYEYYAAVMLHFAKAFGCHYFMMVNEPEYRFQGYFQPASVAALGSEDVIFRTLFHELDDVPLWNEYFASLATQTGVMARMARMALEDVRQTLAPAAVASRLTLAGPVAGNLDVYWPVVGPHVDVCDYHQYSPHGEAYRERFHRASALVKGTTKHLALSEFNRQAGEMEISSLYFSIPEALGFADIAMELLQVATHPGPQFETATMYHFHFPATHRNYKSLVFGDMNRVDWTGQDLRPKGVEQLPTFEEMQIRFATPAYHAFRMIARAVGQDPVAGTPHAVLATSTMVRDTALVPDPSRLLKIVAVDQGHRLVVMVLNLSREYADTVTLDLTPLGRTRGWAVVRELRKEVRDEVTAEVKVEDGRIALALAPMSLSQVIVSDLDPEGVQNVVLEECTFTPGTREALGLWQTTRLRAIAEIGGRRVDLSEYNVKWQSSDPQVVRVEQTGLLQRVRSSRRAVGIRALRADGRVLAETVVPPDLTA